MMHTRKGGVEDVGDAGDASILQAPDYSRFVREVEAYVAYLVALLGQHEGVPTHSAKLARFPSVVRMAHK
jgi:hypothetical protein